MHFIVRVNTFTYADPPFTTYTSTDITPFPYSGRFKVRITGYEFSSDYAVPLGLSYEVYSRALRNPLMPSIFKFIPDRGSVANAGNIIRQFNKTGWWEVDLAGGIDLSVVPYNSTTRVQGFTFLLHLELERLAVPDHLLQ